MRYLNEAIGLLVPGVRFRCMLAVNERGALVREQVVLDGLSEAALDAVLAAMDGGKHNLVAENDKAGRLVLHWLRLADPQAVRPGDEEISKMQAEIARMMAQAEMVRQQLYASVAAPVALLIERTPGRALLGLTATEARAVERFERYTGQAVAMDARMRLLGPLPGVDMAPLVQPVTLHQDGFWLYGEDNRVAWQAYIDG